ncbi:MAG: hypothetical protein U9O89_02290 [Thermoproteota archaeon]|nr:hypothetical protein [Thermoproteota archaeon]
MTGKEDAFMKRDKDSDVVHVENVEFLPTKLVEIKAPKRVPSHIPEYL